MTSQDKTASLALRGVSVPCVTHADLLRIAMKKQCAGIKTGPVLVLCRPEKNFWVFKATVFKSSRCRGFVGYGRFDRHTGRFRLRRSPATEGMYRREVAQGKVWRQHHRKAAMRRNAARQGFGAHERILTVP
jgi:hypothetical protein